MDRVFKAERRNAGFTLVELIVVLVILSILLAILVPSMTSWISRAKDQSAMTECRSAVLAAQAKAIELYSTGELSEQTMLQNRAEIEKLAEVPDASIEIVEADCDANITYLLYHATNGRYVQYENAAYTLVDGSVTVSHVAAYLSTSCTLLSQVREDGKFGNLWDKLRNAFATQYNGNPPLNASEKHLLAQISTDTLQTLTWKPTLVKTSNGEATDVMMIASCDGDSSKNLAYLIYYNGQYYYHDNGHHQQDSAWVSDQGVFDVSILGTDRWKLV